MKNHLLTLLFLSVATACTSLLTAVATPQGVGMSSGGQPENTDPPNNALNDGNYPGTEACISSNASAEFQIAKDFDQSIHELVVCGGIAANISVSFMDGILKSALGKDPKPEDWTYVGEGRWEAGGGMMYAEFILPFDTSFGVKGDVITFDVFDVENFFKGFRGVASASADSTGKVKTKLSIEFTEPGPGFELLGVNYTEGQNAIELDFDAMVENFGKIGLDQEVIVEDVKGDTTVSYNVVAKNVPLANLVFAAGPSNMDIVSAGATNSVTGQTLTVKNFNMVYQGGGARTLDGTLDVEVTGGAFDYGAFFSFPHRATPDVTLGCL